MNDGNDPVLSASRVNPPVSRNGPDNLSERVRSLRLSGQATPTRRGYGGLLPWLLCLLLLASTIAFGYQASRAKGEADASEGSAASAAPGTPSAGGVTDAVASSGDVVLDGKGYVIAAHQIQLSPQVGGEIVWLDPHFKEGAFYEKGAKLAQVDPVIYDAQLKSAEAAVQSAEVNLRQVETGSTLNDIQVAKAQLVNMAAKLDLSRIDDRYNRAAIGGVARYDLDKATAQIRVDQAACEVQKETVHKLEVALEEQRLTARAQLQKARADLEQAKKQRRNCEILAPTTGLILTKKAELGGYVNPLAFGAAGYLCEMADLKDLEVELDVQERDIAHVKAGQRCRIMPEAGQKDAEFLKTHPQGYAGVVSRRLPVANRSKGAITVRVKVDFPKEEKSGEYLLPDMGVIVSFLKVEKK
jgi:multidrug resistance efflux pump